jgi:hypothetical protein
MFRFEARIRKNFSYENCFRLSTSKYWNNKKPKKFRGLQQSTFDLKVLMTENAEFCLVGNDDSGPDDARMIWILSAGARHP